MAEFKVGDRVKERHGNVAGKILSVGDTEKWLVDGDIRTYNTGSVKAFVEITHGPGAGQPYGFMHYDLDQIVHID